MDDIGSAIVKGIKDLAMIDTYIPVDEAKDQKKESRKKDRAAIDDIKTSVIDVDDKAVDIKTAATSRLEQKACTYYVTYIMDRSVSLSFDDISATAAAAAAPLTSLTSSLPSVSTCVSSSSDLTSSLDGVNDDVYFVSRWKNIDTEAVLRGYTPEAPFMATVSAARFLTTPASTDRKVLHVELGNYNLHDIHFL